MANSPTSSSLDYWRNYLKTAKGDIFEVIDNAITVAASDHPEEFKSKRDAIAKRLFSHRFDCSSPPELAKNGLKLVNNDNNDGDGEMNVKHVGNHSNKEIEALTEESECVKEILRIKNVLRGRRKESDSVLFETMGRLQLMDINVDQLKETQIGRAVNPLRKHCSKNVSELAQTLITDWRKLVDDWIEVTTAVKECTPDSLNASDANEEGLPSPPNVANDEGALVATQTGSMELSKFAVSKKGDFEQIGHVDKSKCLDDAVVQVRPEANPTKHQELHQQARNGSNGTSTSIADGDDVGLALPPMDEGALFEDLVPMDLSQFFDGMDDDGNLQQSGEPLKNKKDERIPLAKNQDINKMKFKPSNEENIIAKDSKSTQEKKNATIVRPNKPADSGHAVRPPKPAMQRKSNTDQKMPQNILKDVTAIPKKHQTGQKSSGLDDPTVQMKLEATKRKLHECYQQVDNAKKQRTVQVIELQNLPKQGDCHRYPIVKPGRFQRAYGRK